MRLEKVIVHIAGMACRVANPFDSAERGDGLDQACETPYGALPIGALIIIDVLSDEGHFADACLTQRQYLVKNALDWSRYFRSARIRDHAERAKFIASFLDRDESRDRASSRRQRQMIELVFHRVFSVGLLVVRFQKVHQAVIVLRSDHHINRGLTSDDFLALGLGDAAGDDDLQILSGFAFFRLEVAKTTEIGKTFSAAFSLMWHVLRTTMSADASSCEEE